ncbi:MAG: hypothetical protein IIA59_09645 [Candidatus Marinimicrobia bacterium]|nr:hypothetical protein [Candidatus Neomarinimicrobiota bacterium]
MTGPVSLTFPVDNHNLKLMFRAKFNGLLILILSGCATHPTISPVPLEAGETYLGYTLSVENAMPLIFYRRGMSDKWDVGLRLGMPIYGTGMDVSRILSRKEDRTDVLNLAFSLNPNYNYDFTYYRVRRKSKVKEKKGITIQKLRYFGLRGMVIRSGITGRSSTRFGILFGGAPAIKGSADSPMPRFYRFQWEIGYFHDFSSMPLKALFDPTPFNLDHPLWKDRFAEFPHVDNGVPTEYSRLTGLSIRITFPFGSSALKKMKVPETAQPDADGAPGEPAEDQP